MAQADPGCKALGNGIDPQAVVDGSGSGRVCAFGSGSGRVCAFPRE